MVEPSALQLAVFLDRDGGVLVEDVHLLTQPAEVRLSDGAPWAVQALKEAGYQVVVVSNQTVVARGLGDRARGCLYQDSWQRAPVMAFL